MPFDESKFRLSVETGAVDRVSELGLPSHLNLFGSLRFQNFESEWSDETMKDLQIKDILHYLHIQSPAGSAEARSAVTRYLSLNKTMSNVVAYAFLQYVETRVDEETWTDIGRCISLYHEVLASVRKPYKSKWYKKEIVVNDKVKYTWVNVSPGVEPKPIYGYHLRKDLRRAAGLSVSDKRSMECSFAIAGWKSRTQLLQGDYGAMDRFGVHTPFFKELMEVTWHPKHRFKNGFDEED
eukprot:gene28874-32066_t